MTKVFLFIVLFMISNFAFTQNKIIIMPGNSDNHKKTIYVSFDSLAFPQKSNNRIENFFKEFVLVKESTYDTFFNSIDRYFILVDSNSINKQFPFIYISYFKGMESKGGSLTKRHARSFFDEISKNLNAIDDVSTQDLIFELRMLLEMGDEKT